VEELEREEGLQMAKGGGGILEGEEEGRQVRASHLVLWCVCVRACCSAWAVCVAVGMRMEQ